MRLLSELNAEGMTLVMVTHSLEHAAQASRTLRLLDGRVVVDAVSMGVDVADVPLLTLARAAHKIH